MSWEAAEAKKDEVAQDENEGYWLSMQVIKLQTLHMLYTLHIAHVAHNGHVVYGTHCTHRPH